MQKTILSIVFFLAASSTFAQFNQGRILTGGSVGFSTDTNKSKANSTTTTNGRSTSFTLSPNAGYFVIDNLAVGAALEIFANSYKPDGNGSKSNQSSLSIAPFVRYYLSPGIFFQGQYAVGAGKNKYSVGNTNVEEKYGISAVSLGAGYAHFLNDHVAIEPFIGYRSSSLKDKDDDSKNIDSGLFLNVGLQVYLGNRN
ncbi:MAG: outer membrane beta-barrel protein [Bacteroidota bacterium]